MKRGGSRNKKKDVVDIAHVVDLWLDLSRQQDELFKFGEYKGLWAECSCRPDIVNLVDVCWSLSKVSSSLNVGYGDLKEACTVLFNKDPSLKPNAAHTVPKAAAFVADKLVVVQKHFRSVSLNKGWDHKLAKLMEKLSMPKQEKLNKFVDYLRKLNDWRSDASQPASDVQEAQTKNAISESSKPSSSKVPSCKETPVQVKANTAKKRKLTPKTSSASSGVLVDEYGLPDLSWASQQTDASAPPAGDSLLDPGSKPLPICKTVIRKLKKDPDHKGQPKKRPATSMHMVGKDENSEAPQAEEGTKPINMYTTFGSKQSYITVAEAGSSKKKLWVSITEKMSKKHQDLIRKIFQAKPKTKDEAIHLRAKVLK